MLDSLTEEWSKSPTLTENPADGRILAGMNNVIVGSGPILADHSGVPTPDQAERWYRARATAAYMSATRGKLAWIIPLDVLIVGLLAFIGYPLPRVLALAATLTASLVMFVVWNSRSCSDCLPTITSAQGETLRMVPRFLLMFVGIALTGGVRSPLLPTILLPFSDLVIKNGWSRMAKTILVLIAGGLFAMVVLPAHWFGPDVPQPAYWILLLAILVTAGAWHTRYALVLTRTIGDSACQLGRAREEVVYRAVARAREMEQIGLKLSHELKNPLAAIKGLVQLSARAACDPDSAEQLRVVAAEVDRMESILKEYLSFSRPALRCATPAGECRRRCSTGSGPRSSPPGTRAPASALWWRAPRSRSTAARSCIPASRGGGPLRSEHCRSGPLRGATMARVLLVDDEPALLFTLSRLLKSRGLEPVLAHSGKEALR